MRPQVALWAGIAAIGLLTSSACNGRSNLDSRTGVQNPEGGVVTAPGPEDSAITTRVQARFYQSGELRGLSVRTTGGVVTLGGVVENEVSRQTAVDLARDVAGVTGVDDQLIVSPEPTGSASGTVQGAPRDGQVADAPDSLNDAWITTKIMAQYFTMPEVAPWNIDVSTSGGGMVTLSGRVPNEDARRAALDTARGTEGVRDVEDHLQVASVSPGEQAQERAGALEDTWITAKIQSKYFLDEDVRGRVIDVETSEGAVTLTGEVGSEGERWQAVALAGSTDGVTSVDDRLSIAAAVPAGAGSGPSADTTPVEDGWITTKIQAKYFLDRDIKGREIDVDTRAGVVTLTGRVDSEAARQEAETVARQTRGVREVNNRLTLGTPPTE
jgi:osmotically-inducible protein OsmY